MINRCKILAKLLKNSTIRTFQQRQTNFHLLFKVQIRHFVIKLYALKYTIFMRYTPMAYSLFPWVVSDFGLVDAIESGQVKIPFLPSFDNTHDLEEPKFRNIYKHVSGELSKMGVRTAKKKAKEEAAKAKEEAKKEVSA